MTPSVQKLFDDLSKQYECEWQNDNVIYIKEFEIHINPPYTAECCDGGSNEKAKERLKHILENFALKEIDH